MPYIESYRRQYLDKRIEELDAFICNDGDLNYTISRLALRLINRHGLRYTVLASVLGTLRLVAAEIEQRLVRYYEDIKINQNGDLPEYREMIYPPSYTCKVCSLQVNHIHADPDLRGGE